MINNNLEQATAELREALVNFLGMGKTEEGFARTRAEETYNDLVTWFNWFIAKSDAQTKPLEKAEVSDPDENHV